MRIFLAAHRLRNLGAAARRLGLDISTMSRRLTAFEESIGVRLFERGRHGLAPTPAADAVLVAAEAMEVAHGHLGRQARAFDRAPEGVVRISVPPGLADTFLVPALSVLRERFAGIVIELETSIRVVDLARHEADLALRSIRPTAAELVPRKLMTARSMPLTSPALVRTLGVIRDWNDAPWVTADQDLASLAVSRWVAKHVARERIVLRTSHWGSQIAAAVAGVAVALLPVPYVTVRELAIVRHARSLDGDIESLPVDDLWLVGHRAQREIPRIAAVWEVLVEYFARFEPAVKSRSR
ncbi:MAG: LysR family transcriptional regulator [Deltaproteobacteria bacterium]|nr:LysR family transcriptional regulator [Nannocystaceae bacterium]